MKASQPTFLLLIGIGGLISSANILLVVMDDRMLSADQMTRICNAVPWIYAVGFVLTFATLAAKTYRTYRVFESFVSLEKAKVSHWTFFGYLFGLFSVYAIILLSWQTTSPIEWRRIVVQEDRFGRPIESYGLCHSDDAWEFLTPLMVLGGELESLSSTSIFTVSIFLS